MPECGKPPGACEQTPSAIIFSVDSIAAGPLVAGGTAKVSYDASRLPSCRGDLNGHPGWSITGHYSLAGGPVGSFEAGGYSPSGGTQAPAIPLASSGTLQVWFEITSAWGCQAWDSDYGRNFRFQVEKPARLSFNADYNVTAEGTLRAGAPITIEYALSRLPHCRQTYNGLGTWEIQMGYRFDGGAVAFAPMTAPSANARVAAPAVLQAPPGARDLEVWFHNTDRAGCSEWDSRYGANHHFAVR